MLKPILSLLLCCLVSAGCTPQSAPPETDTADTQAALLLLSDGGVTLNGEPVTGDATAAVHTGAEIVYYKDGTDETYGEGSEEEKHSAQEAAAHTVVTITQPGAYRLQGSLSAGQIAVDLGEDAAEDPEAVVTLILDGVDVTCTVAPALIFYNVYECGVVDTETASPTVDTTDAGANVLLAADSENHFTGSHVARIYKEGTTKKLHKYDGAFYSKMSMNIDGEEGGVLNVVSDNEGINSELHLTVNGGTIRVESRDDGINTNEDFVSVTTINGGELHINAGLGAEGDGIDSNGYLTINGGSVWTMARFAGADGGIDADCAITLNGGTLYAFGSRNDATDSASAQPYMELSFASTLPAGSQVALTDSEGGQVWSAVTEKDCQAITLTCPELALDTVYNLYVDGVLQCYSGTGFAGMGGGMRGPRPEGMEPPEGFDPGQMGQRPEGMEPPEGFDPSQMGQRPEGMEPPEGFDPSQMGQRPEGMEPPEGFDPSQMGQRPEGMEPPEGFDPGQRGGFGGMAADGSGSTEFILTESAKSFSGVCDSDASGKTRVTFTVETEGADRAITAVTAITPSEEIDPALVQVTVADDPSEDYAASCLLSDGLDAVNALLPEDEGSYVLTVAVVSGAEGFTGVSQRPFTVPAAEESE